MLRGSEREVMMLQYDAILPSFDMTQASPIQTLITVTPLIVRAAMVEDSIDLCWITLLIMRNLYSLLS